MAQSPEYPDLPFVQPRAYGTGRDGRSVQYVVIHYTAGSERATSAEDGAAYDARRTDGTSCHYFHDQNSTVQCVLTYNRANSAFAKGNRLGIQHELCGTQQTREQWLDPASDATLWRTARQVARDCRKYGIPARKLSPAEVRAAWYDSTKPKGICGHADVTLAYPEDGGDHMDPGTAFPWDVLLERVSGYLTHGDNWTGADMAEGYGYPDPGMPQAQAWRMDAIMAGSETVRGGPYKGESMAIIKDVHGLQAGMVVMGAKLDQILTKLDALASSGATGLSEQQVEDAAFRGAQRAEDG